MTTESFSVTPLTQVAPSYLYFQYQDDDDLQAFVNSYNQITQGYIDWFNNNSLGLYTSSSISGQLLDWVASGIYGISRPYLSSITTITSGAINTNPINNSAINAYTKSSSGTSSIVSDDIYKRVLTWYSYRGDGHYATIDWLRRRVARFVYGQNGSDVTLDQVQNVKIYIPYLPPMGAVGTYAINTMAVNELSTTTALSKKSLAIQIPTNAASQSFQTLITEGYINLPFQITFKVILQ